MDWVKAARRRLRTRVSNLAARTLDARGDRTVDGLPASPDAVRWAYRLLLGREPESRAAIESHLAGGAALGALRNTFLGSEEFKSRIAGAAAPRLSGMEAPMAVDVEVDADLEARLLRHVAASWQHLGEVEPHWSVLAAPEFMRDRIDENRAKFFDSGKPDVTRMLAFVARHRLALRRDGVCVELGCGLGRVTRWLSEVVERVIAIDISRPHLDLAAQRAADVGAMHCVEWLQLNDLSVLEASPPIDLFFSIIVLQHNPPPLIARMLEVILQKLAPGGVAYFQVPTYREGYRFDASEYLRRQLGKREMEMHVLPQEHVFAIATRTNCDVLEVAEDGMTGWRSGERSNTFFMRKR